MQVVHILPTHIEVDLHIHNYTQHCVHINYKSIYLLLTVACSALRGSHFICFIHYSYVHTINKQIQVLLGYQFRDCVIQQCVYCVYNGHRRGEVHNQIINFATFMIWKRQIQIKLTIMSSLKMKLMRFSVSEIYRLKAE